MPFTLTPGHYQLAAWGYNLGTDANYNNSGPGGAITFSSLDGAVTATGTHYSDHGAPGAFATNQDNGATRYGAGTMIGYSIRSMRATASDRHTPDGSKCLQEGEKVISGTAAMRILLMPCGGYLTSTPYAYLCEARKKDQQF